jgi:equilibrative nucleoside transporter 1/2/3
MFLAAAPYFTARFAGDAWIQANFQSAILTVSTITNLGAMLVLTSIQYTASYPFRINLALVINVVTFGLLTASTVLGLNASPTIYLVFLLATVAAAAWAAGLIQNGAFAFAASFGRPEYMQAIMAGQGIAGVLPPSRKSSLSSPSLLIQTKMPKDRPLKMAKHRPLSTSLPP